MRRDLTRLESEIALCERCYGHARRLPARFARRSARPGILVLLERPPRRVLGAERLGLDNDDAGTTFLRRMTRAARLDPDRIALGAASLCRPGAPSLERAVPPAVCVRECAGHVRELVDVLRPRLVVPLGRAALRSLREAFPDQGSIASLRFPECVGRTVVAGTTWVHPLYLTTSRARVTRPEAEQRKDWRAVGRLWEWIESGAHGRMPSGRRRPKR